MEKTTDVNLTLTAHSRLTDLYLYQGCLNIFVANNINNITPSAV